MFKDNIGNVLDKDWYEKTFGSKDGKENIRIVTKAAEICLAAIKSIEYKKNIYELPDLKKDNLFKDVPVELRAFLDTIIKTNKDENESNQLKYDRKIATISHCIISAARPHSFTSPILLGLSTLMHYKFASKNLIDSFANVGLCFPYKKVLNFESSIIFDPHNHAIADDAYIQLVYDNADHSTCTIDGRNTFHSMGGIMIVTPASSVTNKKIITKLEKTPRAEDIAKIGFVELKQFEKKNSDGLKKLIIENVYDEACNKFYEISMEDFSFLYSKFLNVNSVGWSGYMERIHAQKSYDTSKIIPLSFLNHLPSNYDTIFTVLVQAADYSKKFKQDTMFVTFDQPLWQKSREILASVDPKNDPYNLSSVIVRLGGFHLLMSFLGSVGNIMDGSGLKEALSEIYAEKSVEKALLGHAYARAIRGHFLVQIALTNKIFSLFNLTATENTRLDMLLQDLKLQPERFVDKLKKPEFRELKKKFVELLDLIKTKG